MAASFVVIGALNLVRKNGPAHRVAYDLDPAEEDEPVIEHMFSPRHPGRGRPGPGRPGALRRFPAGPAAGGLRPAALDAQGRLEQLQRLLDAGLVTKGGVRGQAEGDPAGAVMRDGLPPVGEGAPVCNTGADEGELPCKIKSAQWVISPHQSR